jgi:hypothetical protein
VSARLRCLLHGHISSVNVLECGSSAYLLCAFTGGGSISCSPFSQLVMHYAVGWLLQQDPRTNHAAAAVIKGKKYAANAWIHLYDFAKSNLWGCTGAFDYL